MNDAIQKVDRRRRENRPAKAIPAEPQPMSIDAAPETDEAPEQASARTQTRGSSRTKSDGRLEVTGRNGEVLSRTRTYVGDIFEIPKEMIPKGWGFQWNAVSISGNAEILLDQNHMMHQNGWRAVPAERFAGTLVPKGSTGPIIRGQQMLMERPQSLIDEANSEDLRNAQNLINDRNESLKLTKVKAQLPEGMEMSGKYRGTGGGMRMSVDKSLDVLNVNRQAGNYETE